MSRRIATRKRWFTQVNYSAEVEPRTPIPYQGKGENSWDCGEDGLHSMMGPAQNLEEAIAATVRSVLGSRRKYDGDIMAKYPAPA
jgi:hypothetical protein